MHEIYLDNASASQVDEDLLDRLRSFQASYWACPSSPYPLGQLCYLPHVTSVKKLYDIAGAHESDHFFYSASSIDAIEQLFLSTYLTHIKETGRTHIYSLDGQMASILFSLKKMEMLGCRAKTLPVNRFGQLTAQALEEGLRPRAGMLTLSLACPLTGVVQPIHEIAKICKEKMVLLHVDVTHAVGKYYFRFDDLPIDFMTFDASAFHGPKGCAGAFVKSLSPIPSTMSRSAGDSIPHICVLAEAFELAAERFDGVCTETARLRDRLESNIISALPDVTSPFADAERLPTSSVLCFAGVTSEALLYLISSKGVCATMGGGAFQKLSHVLSPYIEKKELCLGALSFSLSYRTTQEEIDKASSIIIDAYKKLKTLSGPLCQEGVV